MASKAFEGNYKAWILSSEPSGWDPDSGGVVTATELAAGTRLLRLISAGAISYTYNMNTASQAILDTGKIGHNAGTREVTGGMINHEFDDPIEDDTMYQLYAYGDPRFLIVAPVAPDNTPADGAQLYGFQIETGEPNPINTAQDTKQNFKTEFATQDWDFKITFDASN